MKAIFYGSNLSEQNSIRRWVMTMVIFAMGCTAYAQDREWVRQIGGPGYDFGYSVVADRNGNVYSAGEFAGSVIFGNNFHLNASGDRDAYVSMHDSNGNLQWVQRFGGSTLTNATSVKITNEENILVCGSFWSRTDFDPGVGENYIAPAGETDIYVACLDARGNLKWVKTFGGTGYDHVYTMAVDNENNIVIAGDFSRTADFDPGNATMFLSSVGEEDIYVAKLRSDGELIWVQQIGGTKKEIATSVSVDSKANVYVGGFFGGPVDFDPGMGVFHMFNEGFVDAFLIKLDHGGNLRWAKQFKGASYEFVNSVSTDKEGNTYVTGCYTGTVDFDPSIDSLNLKSEGFMDIFVLKINTGGSLLWAKGIGSKYNDYGAAISVDGEGSAYITGFYAGFIDLGMNGTIASMTSVDASSDIFVLKLNASGNYQWHRSYGGMDEDTGFGIFVDAFNNTYVTGIFQDKADFNSRPGTFFLTSRGAADAFVMKLGERDISMSTEEVAIEKTNSMKLFPNPSSDQITIELDEKTELAEVMIIDATGKTVIHEKMNSTGTLVIDISNLSNGVYLVKVVEGEMEMTSSFVKK
jgi:hypothetical protein